jgi:TRL-like protein family
MLTAQGNVEERAMRNVSVLLAALVLVLLITGCVFAPVNPPRGFIYTNQKAPLFPGNGGGEKVGEASTYSILLLVAWGDASITAAAKDGGITKIKQLDYQVFNILPIWQEYTTIVRGD